MKPKKFITIDDDGFNNSLCKLIVRRTLGITDVESFTNAEKGLEYIVTSFKINGIQQPTILFLDINMPIMNGWEFLEYFDKLDPIIKRNIFVCILSSSVDSRDRKRAEANSNVYKYLVKPFSSEMLTDLMSNFI
jgi:response regulator RpfG family c-di-GMP phosphodiesterase